MDERRYNDEQIRRIFELAASGRPTGRPERPAAAGLTLGDIQSIGTEVGIEPSAVARAAASLDAERALGRRLLGMPIGVGRVVALPRAPTDHEWDRLVAELRATFRAQGRVSVQGGLREWSNGNLHACIEPSDTGWRLRLGTVKGNAADANALGFTGLAAAAILGGSLLASGAAGESNLIWVSALFGASGLGAFVFNMVRLPRWARQRAEQMVQVANTFTAIMTTGEQGKGPAAKEGEQ
jgi:hypothetical protein